MFDKTALLIIDMQKDVLKKLPKSEMSVVSKTQEALKRAREKRMPVFFVLRIHRKDGIDVEPFRSHLFEEKPYLVEGSEGARLIDKLKPLASEYIVSKRRFSGFFQSDLLLLLTRLGMRSLVICGVQTPNCIRCTVTDAIAYDYSVTVLEDATAAQNKAIHQANLLDMQNMGVQIKSVQQFFSKRPSTN